MTLVSIKALSLRRKKLNWGGIAPRVLPETWWIRANMVAGTAEIQVQDKAHGNSQLPDQLRLGEDPGTLQKKNSSQKKFWMYYCGKVLVTRPELGL